MWVINILDYPNVAHRVLIIYSLVPSRRRSHVIAPTPAPRGNPTAAQEPAMPESSSIVSCRSAQGGPCPREAGEGEGRATGPGRDQQSAVRMPALQRAF